MTNGRPPSLAKAYDPTLFDESGRWDLSLDPMQEERVAASLSLIPGKAQTILDIGCGNGSITRRMAAGRHVVGCDTSRRGLKDLGLSCVCGSLANLPFRSGSFDLVTAFEVLEHLPPDLGRQACAEMARLARSSVLLTVPNRENLEARFTRCPGCRTPFHVYNHLMSFSPDDMGPIVPGFRLAELRVTPHTRPGAERVVCWLRSLRIPLYEWAANATCPNCRLANFGTGRLQALGLRCVGLARRLTPWWLAPGGWILALYDRND